MRDHQRLLRLLSMVLMGLVVPAAAQPSIGDVAIMLQELGVQLAMGARPPLSGGHVDQVQVRLLPQQDGATEHVVSFELPFAPGDLVDDQLIHVLDEEGARSACIPKLSPIGGSMRRRGSPFGADPVRTGL